MLFCLISCKLPVTKPALWARLAECDLSQLGEPLGCDYLLGLPLWSLTSERIADLDGKIAKSTEQLHDLEASSPSSLWLRDLDHLEPLLLASEQLDVGGSGKITTPQRSKTKAKGKCPPKSGTAGIKRKRKHIKLQTTLVPKKSKVTNLQ
jgi:hypothetical protein